MTTHEDSGKQVVYATTLELMNRFQEPEGRAAIEALGLPTGSRGLDVGCGVGLYALWLAEAIGANGGVVALDPSAERVAEAKRLIGGAPTAAQVTLKVGDGTALDEADCSFDWVWCGDVLHHIDEPLVALGEFKRVLRPGGLLAIKESQVLQAMFLPGHLALERQLQRAEVAFSQAEAGEITFQERRQRTRETMLAAGLSEVVVKTVIVQRQAPLDEASKTYIQQAIFDRNWGPRLRPLLDARDWAQRSALCEADSPESILARPDYYCIYPVTVFSARVPS